MIRLLVGAHRRVLWGAALVLAASVGMNLIVFTFANALWLRRPPFPHPDRLVTVLGLTWGQFGGDFFPTVEATEGQVATYLLGVTPRFRFAQVDRDLETLGVTSGYFRLFGLPILGRDFLPDDDRPEAEPVAIISYRLWSSGLNQRMDVIDSVVAGQPVSLRVVGVAPTGFEGAWRGERADIWVPRTVLAKAMLLKSAGADLPMAALVRLKPGDTISDANRRLKRSRREFGDPTVSIVSLADVYGAPESPSMVVREGNAVAVVAGLAGLVLFGGCAAIAALVLVHYERRRVELAVRAALGASRTRLLRELVGELGAVAIAGGCGAVAVAAAGLKVMPALALPGGVDLSRLDVTIDWTAVSVALSGAIVALAIAACLPVARSTRVRLGGELLMGPTTTASTASQHIRQGLLALLVCASVVVLIAAGLFVRAVQNGFGDAAGFDYGRMIFATVHVTPPMTPFGTFSPESVAARTAQVKAALNAIPGVENVAEAMPPIDPDAARLIRLPATITTANDEHQMLVAKYAGSPELLATLGVSFLAGRGLSAADLASRPVPAVITQSLSRRLWPEAAALGQTLVGRNWRGGPLIVVGIVRDFAFGSLAAPAAGVVIVDSDPSVGSVPRFVIRQRQPRAVSSDEVLRAVAATLPDVAAPQIATGLEVVAHDLGRQRLGAWFFSGFGIIALLVGLGSVFGLVAYLAESRQREYGVRLALGATWRDLLQLGVHAALVPVSLGLAVGLGCAAIVSRVFGALLIGLAGIDLETYAIVALAMLLSATAAAVAGSLRLRRIMPSEALRTI